MRNITIVIVSLAGAVGAAVGVTTAGAQTQNDRSSKAAQTAPPWQANYSVLRNFTPTAGVGLPAGVPSEWGIDPTSVHELPTAQSDPARIWIAMSANGPCIIASPNRIPYLWHPNEPGGGTCGGASGVGPSLTFGGLARGNRSFSAGETLGIGMVPDGVQSVTLHRRDGSTESLPVSDNIYSFDSAGPTTLVTFAAPSTGSVSQEVYGAN